MCITTNNDKNVHSHIVKTNLNDLCVKENIFVKILDGNVCSVGLTIFK
jgi:hypothetical protein